MSKRKRSAGSPYQMRTVPARPDPRQQALRAFQAGRLDTAISVWSNLSGSDPGVRAALAEAHFCRALTQSGAARVADLRHAVELAPGQLRYQYHLARALHLADDLPAAIDTYRAVLQRDTGWKGAGMGLAVAMLEQDPRADIAGVPRSNYKNCNV